MAQPIIPPFTHTDIELIRIRMKLSPGQRLQAMLDARMVLVGFIRARLRRRYPDLSEQELNLKVLEEIDRAQQLATPTQMSNKIVGSVNVTN